MADSGGVIIFFDTTVLFTDVHASRPLMNDILRGASSGDWQLIVPGVVIEEAVRQYPARLHKTLDESRRAIGKHRTDLQALGLPVPEMPQVGEEALVAAYERNLRATLSAPG